MRPRAGHQTGVAFLWERRDASRRCAGGRTSIYVLFLCYPRTCETIVNTFRCYALPDGREYLLEDFNVRCDDGYKALMYPSALVALVAYAAGVPATFFWRLYMHREVLQARNVINTMLSEKTGQSVAKITADSSRTRYMNAEQALAYGLVDKILKSEDDLPTKPQFLAQL